MSPPIILLDRCFKERKNERNKVEAKTDIKNKENGPKQMKKSPGYAIVQRSRLRSFFIQISKQPLCNEFESEMIGRDGFMLWSQTNESTGSHLSRKTSGMRMSRNWQSVTSKSSIKLESMQ
jgi:hypothetical protein